MPEATTKPVTVTYFTCTTARDFADVLSFIVAHNYRGTLAAYIDGKSNAEMWTFEANGPGNPSPVTATLGDVITWDGTRLDVMTQVAFTERCTIA